MKHYTVSKSICLAICLFLIGISAFAQKKIVLDFATKKITAFEVKDTLRGGDMYQLQIKNINTFLYKIAIQTKDTITEHQLKFPGFGSLNPDSMKTLTATLSSLSLLSSVAPVYGQQKMLGEDENVRPTKTKKEIEAARIEAVKERIDAEHRQLQNNVDDLEIVKTRIDSQSFAVKKFMLSALVEDTSNTIFNKLGGKTYSIDRVLRSMDDIRSSLAQEQKSVIDNYAQYLDDLADYQDIINASAEIKNADGKVKTIYDLLKKTIGDALALVDASICEDVLKKMVVVENNRKREYLSLPFQLTGDQTRMHITIMPRDSGSYLQTYCTDYVFPWAKNWFVGVGSSFYVSFLHDEAYSTVTTISTDTSYKVIQENPGYIEIGMQAMMMFGFCQSDYGYCYLSFGPAISISNKIKPRLLIGAGYALGTKNLFTIGLNLIGGEVDRKSEAIQLDTKYARKPEQISVSRMDYGIAFTVGYVFNL